MLNNIPHVVSPDLLKALCEMGHGDRIVLADANFPGASIAARCGIKLLRLDGVPMPALLDAVLELIPLDRNAQTPMLLMDKMECDSHVETPIWDLYAQIAEKRTEAGRAAIGRIGRFDFYKETEKAYCIVMTGELAVYANVMLQKGVVK